MISNKNDKIKIWVKRIEKSSLYESILGLINFLLFSVLFIINSKSNLLLIFGIFGLTIFFFIYMYGGTIKRAKIANHIIDEIRIKNEYIEFKTYPYSILGLINKDPIQCFVRIAEVKVKDNSFPIQDKKFFENMSCKTIQVNSNNYFLFLENDYPEQKSLFETLETISAI